MDFHELRFESPAGLTRAFGRVLECQQVEDCLVDGTRLTLSFRAPAATAADLFRGLRQAGEASVWTFQLVGDTHPD